MAGLFDNFSLSGSDASSLVSRANSAGVTSLGGLGGAQPSAASGGNIATDGNAFYKVKIVAQTEHAGIMTIIADCPAEFAFDTQVDYDSPYQNIVEDTLINNVPDRLRGAAKSLNTLAKVGGTKAFTQALTAKVWNGAGSTTLSLPLIFHVEKDADAEVMMPLMKLMYLTMPKESVAGGFLSSPGPSFSMQTSNSSASSPSTDKIMASGQSKTMVPNTSTGTGAPMTSTDTSLLGGLKESIVNAFSGAYTAGSDLANSAGVAVSKMIKEHVANSISIQIGGGFYLDNIVIKSVNQTHKMSPVGLGPGMSSGINSMVSVTVVIETFYTLTQRDIAKMLMPMNTGNAPKTTELYNKLIGQ